VEQNPKKTYRDAVNYTIFNYSHWAPTLHAFPVEPHIFPKERVANKGDFSLLDRLALQPPKFPDELFWLFLRTSISL